MGKKSTSEKASYVFRRRFGRPRPDGRGGGLRRRLEALKAAKGLEGTRPIGKWSTATGSYWHWVVEELPSETLILVK